MEQSEEVKKPNLHPMRERAAARVAHSETELKTFESEEVDEDAFVIRLVLDVVAGHSDRSLFDEAGDLKEGCQSTALLVVAEGLMQCFESDLSVKDGLMLKLSLTAVSACGYYPDIKKIPAENPHPEGEELDYDNALEVTAEPEKFKEIPAENPHKVQLTDVSQTVSENNQTEIDQTDLDTGEIIPEEPNE